MKWSYSRIFSFNDFFLQFPFVGKFLITIPISYNFVRRYNRRKAEGLHPEQPPVTFLIRCDDEDSEKSQDLTKI